MWKIAVGFAVFAGLAIYILSKGGDIDMSGEKHGDTTHTEAPAAPAKTASAAPSALVFPPAVAGQTTWLE